MDLGCSHPVFRDLIDRRAQKVLSGIRVDVQQLRPVWNLNRQVLRRPGSTCVRPKGTDLRHVLGHACWRQRASRLNAVTSGAPRTVSTVKRHPACCSSESVNAMSATQLLQHGWTADVFDVLRVAADYEQITRS